MAICRLCEQEKDLQVSHIVPKFIFDWLKESSATGVLRHNSKINKRVQDGLRLPYLCKDCEGLMSKWETYFSKNVFYPLINSTDTVNYDDNFLKFCASVSWRVLKYFVETGNTSHFNSQLTLKLNQALSSWKAFILGKFSNPGEFEQHFFNFRGELEGNSAQLASNIHRYLQRSVAIDVITNNNATALVYIKMPNFLLIGYISLPSRSNWRTTRVCLKNGIIKPQAYNFSTELWKYMQEKASKLNELNQSISNNQSKTIKESYLKDLDKAAQSETLRSMEKDVRLFGIKAVFANDLNEDEEN